MQWSLSAALALLVALTPAARAEPLTLAPRAVTSWKAVYGTVSPRDRIPARSRLGGTLVLLSVTEGDEVAAGQVLARVVDDKLDFQLAALAAERAALAAQLANAEADLARGESLLADGVTTAQRVDALRTQAEVLRGQITAVDARADVVTQQAREGDVLAPVAGRVLQVPVTKGAVVLPGEAIAVIAGGGNFLRLAVPERHAAALNEGDTITLLSEGGDREGRLARVFPLIEGGRVLADVEIDGLPDRFVGARLLVRLPVGERQGLFVPADSIVTQTGLDFVGLATPEGVRLRSIVPGERLTIDGIPMVEVLSGLAAGDVVVPAASVEAGTGAQHD